MYDDALRTVVIAAIGDYWTYRIVTRADVPGAGEDFMDTSTQPWDELKFPPPVVLGTRDSDQRMKDILDDLRNAKLVNQRIEFFTKGSTHSAVLGVL